MSGTAVLAMAYGTPAGPEDLEAYYTHIRRGRPPTPELLAELRGRYAAIGGHSPLLELTRAQVTGLERALADEGHQDFQVALGMKHAPPFIEDAVAGLAAAGSRQILGVVLAPHYSKLSVGEYAERASAAAAAAPGAPEVSVVRSWHLAAGYLDFLSHAVTMLSERCRQGWTCVHTSCSLPTASPRESLTNRIPTLRNYGKLPPRWRRVRGWSAGRWRGRAPDARRSPGSGPDVLKVLGELAAADVGAVVVCPAGFVADHLEILYDLDIEARVRARELGIAFARTASPNADPRLMRTLARVVLEQVAEGAATP